MAVTHNRFTIGTALTQVVADSADSQEVWLQNLSPKPDLDRQAKEGYAYLLQREFTVSSPGTAIFQVETGATGLQINSYEIISTSDNIKAELVEGPTIGTTGAAIPAYNLNREFSDAHDVVFTAGTSITGGTVIAAEYVTADKHAASGGRVSGRIYTLAPSTTYGFKFINEGNQTTTVFFQMAFVELFNGNTDVWVGDSIGTGVRVRGGDTVHMTLLQGQKLFATSPTDNDLMVTRQD